MWRVWVGASVLAAACASGPSFDVALESCGPEQAEGTITNNGSSVAEAEVTVTWYDADGVVVYTGKGYTQALPAGATGRWHVGNLSGIYAAEDGVTKPNLKDCEVAEVAEFEMPQRE